MPFEEQLHVQMLILCTNDDGYLALGLEVLAGAAKVLGTVEIVAPDREQSATSHSLTMHHPLRARRVREGVSHVDGTPTDCVALAVGALLERRPVCVLSGVNHGPNMGEDVLYSGTVAGAMEATILGIPAVAISYAGRDVQRIGEYQPLLQRLLPQLMDRDDFPPQTLLNVNLPAIPPDEVKGVEVTHLGRRVFKESVAKRTDPHGRDYYWLGVGSAEWSAPPGTDYHAVSAGWVSVTPLHLDLTNHQMLRQVTGWRLSL